MERRSFVCGAAAVLAATPWEAVAQARRRTPGQVLGPYYPVLKPHDADADLTRIEGRPQRAAGQLLRVGGTVLNEAGDPVPDALIEIWQADWRGHYAHRSDKTASETDPNFQGFATLRADRNGRYRFTTIKPAPYLDDGAGAMRAPHIHFQVTGKFNRIITQMYFPGEVLNDTDRVLAFANAGRTRLIAQVDAGPGPRTALAANWDIVLRDG